MNKKIRCDTPDCPCQILLKANRDLGNRFVYLSSDKKLVWFEVPKCASDALRLNGPRIFGLKGLPLKVSKKQQAPPTDVLQNSEWFKFAVVRNPFDRIVSAWKMFTTVKSRVNQLKFHKPSTPFTSAEMTKLESLDPRQVESFDLKQFVQFSKIVRNHHWEQQCKFIPVEPDLIIRVENLQDGFNTLCDKVGVPQEQLPHTNKSKHEHYTEYYDDETRELVAEEYAEDIERFGYEFGAT